MAKPKILLQLDSDPQSSSFDAVVAIDAGVEHLLSHAGVSPQQAIGLTHGAMFTRGGQDLSATAIFIGGSQVEQAEAIARAVKDAFFGPVRVSVMVDPNGANTTAAAAVLSAEQVLSLKDRRVLILGGSGPVGVRIASILGMLAADQNGPSQVKIVSRSLDRANQVCQQITENWGESIFQPCQGNSPQTNMESVAESDIIFAAGAAGVSLLPEDWLKQGDSSNDPRVAIDLNAVPPAGLPGIEVTDRQTERSGWHCFGAIGVGGLKMKVHKQAIRQLFSANDLFLDTPEIYALAKSMIA